VIRSLTARTVVLFLLFDVVFSIAAEVAYVQLVVVHANLGKVIGLIVAVNLARYALWSGYVVSSLAKVSRWESLGGNARTDEALREADSAIQTAPNRIALLHAALFGLQQWIQTFWLLNVAPDWAVLSSEALAGTLAMGIAMFGGILSFGFPLAQVLITDLAGKLYLEARARGIDLTRSTGSMQSRIVILALCLALSPMAWLASASYMQGSRIDENEATTRAKLVVARLSRALDGMAATTAPTSHELVALAERESGEKEGAFIVDPQGHVAGGAATRALEGNQALLSNVAQLAKAPTGSTRIDSWNDRTIVLERTAKSYVVGAVANRIGFSSGFVTAVAVFSLSLLLWAPLTSSLLSRSVAGPVERVTSASRKVVEEGKLETIGTLPASRNDEVGALTEHFNEVLELMRSLSKAATAIAKGDLTVSVPGHGDLPEAFRAMLENLRAIVQELRGTSMDLASAASEIFAASQEQEAAATMQSSAMLEISRTMDNLAESSANVVESVNGVLGNAERTLENTDDMVKRIAQLGAHANRIGEILDVIRDIADRSDLLALNGSLEASRAGESGRGFALVAGEMRRLAERVTASVQDVKALVSDIRDSGSSTVMATEESKKLAQGTTEAARQITFAAQQQQTSTDQVSQGMRDIANVVSQAVSATTQTRTSAEGLKRRADTLSHVVLRFNVEGQLRG
jgi:methyl-accepting chemotaxis protein